MSDPEDYIKGLEKAKAIVLRRTEIPKDAREPTRDAVVILGEEIAEIIEEEIRYVKGEVR